MAVFTQKDIDKNRRLIERQENADTERLYANIPDAIKYMQEVFQRLKPKAYQGVVCLDEHWTGYEDMEMIFKYHTFESDDEVLARLQENERARIYQEQEREKQRQREERRKQYEKLKQEFGR